MKNVLLTVLAVLLLVAFAAALPSPAITDAAHALHLDLM